MIALSCGLNGAARYAIPSTVAFRSSGKPLIFSVSAAGIGPETEAYLAFIDSAINTEAGRFLRRPQRDQLLAHRARITAVYRTAIRPDALVAARYVVPFPGALRFAGGFVHPEMRGRALSAALGAMALFDAFRRGEQIRSVTSRVRVQDDVPNKASVAALRKLGFVLGDADLVTPVNGDASDRHLLPYAEMQSGAPVTRSRPLFLSDQAIPGALRFLQTWRG
ncbi:MAG: GNAT family protein [Pseudomonadota bacterium]